MVIQFKNPFDTLLDIQRAFDSVFEGPFLRNSFSGGGAYPPIDIFDTKDDFVVLAEMPGVKKESLDIKYEKETLTISGETKKPEWKGAAVHRNERSFGEFSRSINLPREVDADKIEANLENGILAIKLPKAEAAKAKKIAIN